jgi:hypothetical protein
MKRMSQGRLPYGDFLAQLESELGNPARRPTPGTGPLALETHATEMAKRVIAYVLRVLMEHDLASLANQQQHLEILSNMIIDVFAMDSVVNRTRLLLGRDQAANALRLALTHVFVASANARVLGGARRLIANEVDGEELRAHGAVLDGLVPEFPIRTIAMKTQIAERLAACGLGPVFLR